LGIQAKTVLSDPIVFNPFGVRFGVRFINPAQWEKWRSELPAAGWEMTGTLFRIAGREAAGVAIDCSAGRGCRECLPSWRSQP
jgi:hypothetical protein